MMKIVVPINLVPDLVEEITVDDTGVALDMEWIRLIINELDDHAMEQAILLKEATGGHVSVIAPDLDGIDDVLYTALARGADKIIKLTGDFGEPMNNHTLAQMLKPIIEEIQPDIVLTGVQAHHDLDGSVGPLLAEYLKMQYVGYVSGISPENGKTTIRKEYPGGLVAEMDVMLPAVFGIQSAEKPPRYVAISKVRQAMKTASIDSIEIETLDIVESAPIDRMYVSESAERAVMLEGDEEEVAEKIIKLFEELGVL